MGAVDLLTRLASAGFRLTPNGDKLRVEPASRLTDELRSLIWENKLALLAALSTNAPTQCSLRDAPPAAATMAPTADVLRLRLLLEAEDGRRYEAILAIPRARYDGLRVLELCERHLADRTTRVISIGPLDED